MWRLKRAGRETAPTPTARCHNVGPVTGEPGTAGLGRLRVVIAEDSVLLLAGLTKLLESTASEVAATAGDASGLPDRHINDQSESAISF